MKTLTKKLEIHFVSPHAPAPDTVWAYPRCLDCWCEIQRVHTHDSEKNTKETQPTIEQQEYIEAWIDTEIEKQYHKHRDWVKWVRRALQRQWIPTSLSHDQEIREKGRPGIKLKCKTILPMWETKSLFVKCRICNHKRCMNTFNDKTYCTCDVCDAEQEQKQNEKNTDNEKGK